MRSRTAPALVVAPVLGRRASAAGARAGAGSAAAPVREWRPFLAQIRVPAAWRDSRAPAREQRGDYVDQVGPSLGGTPTATPSAVHHERPIHRVLYRAFSSVARRHDVGRPSSRDSLYFDCPPCGARTVVESAAQAWRAAGLRAAAVAADPTGLAARAARRALRAREPADAADREQLARRRRAAARRGGPSKALRSAELSRGRRPRRPTRSCSRRRALAARERAGCAARSARARNQPRGCRLRARASVPYVSRERLACRELRAFLCGWDELERGGARPSRRTAPAARARARPPRRAA